jgi:hypothetical protein
MRSSWQPGGTRRAFSSILNILTHIEVHLLTLFLGHRIHFIVLSYAIPDGVHVGAYRAQQGEDLLFMRVSRIDIKPKRGPTNRIGSV